MREALKIDTHNDDFQIYLFFLFCKTYVSMCLHNLGVGHKFACYFRVGMNYYQSQTCTCVDLTEVF